jgi:hypothetical protein
MIWVRYRRLWVLSWIRVLTNMASPVQFHERRYPEGTFGLMPYSGIRGSKMLPWNIQWVRLGILLFAKLWEEQIFTMFLS